MALSDMHPASAGPLTVRGDLAAPFLRRSFVLAFIAAWFVLCAQMIWMYWAQTAVTLPDADDAMRLVQLREFLGGKDWFDLREQRLLPPIGYDSHWSRLIDAGLAALFYFFRPFTEPASAERLMLVVWPMLWLIPAIAAVSMIAWRIAGFSAAMAVLLFAAFCGPGMQQFIPGRIDHHNAHIALSLLVIACAVCADRFRWAAASAGALSAFAVAIGFESLPYLAFCGAIFAMRFVFDREAANSLRAYGTALAAGTLAAFLLTVPPGRWTTPVCDMIAINSALPLIVTGIALAAIASWRSENFRNRFAALGAAGAAAAAIFVSFEPRCLGGVYALVDPAIRPIWLDRVSETKSLFEITARAPVTGLGTVAYPAAALAALCFVMRRAPNAKSREMLTAAAAFLLSFVYMLAVARGSAYAVWLGMPFVALAAIQFFHVMNWKSVGSRFAALALLTPTVVTIGAISLVAAAGGTSLELRSAARQACVQQPNFAALAALPGGIVATNEMEWGPYVLAWTGHSVLAAPYHRIPAGIVASHRIFNSPPEDARREMERTGVDYLFVCNVVAPLSANSDEWRASLIGQIKNGILPAWLSLAGNGPVAIYRFERANRTAQ
jgi:hypothetical protein